MQRDQSNAGVLFGTLRASRKCISEGLGMIKSSPRDLPSTLSRCECSGLRRPPIRLRRRRPKAGCAAWPRAGPFKPRRYRSRRANDAVPSRRRRAAPRVLEIATSAPPDPFLALVGARARRESDPRSTPTLTSCQRAGRRPDLRVVPPPSSLVQFLPRETRREKTRPRSAANICVGVR
jgi:hypothetical protein